MSIPILNTPTGVFVAVGGASAAVSSTLGSVSTSPGVEMWLFTTTTNCWIAQGIAPTVFTTDGVSNNLVATGHKLRTGEAFTVSTTTTLPTGLSAATVYFAIVVDANTWKVATSYANAIAGTSIVISSTGTGVQTADTTAVAGAGSAQIGPNNAVLIDATMGAKLAVIQDTVAGKASLVRVMLLNR